jgi:hypothetical protein
MEEQGQLFALGDVEGDGDSSFATPSSTAASVPEPSQKRRRRTRHCVVLQEEAESSLPPGPLSLDDGALESHNRWFFSKPMT